MRPVGSQSRVKLFLDFFASLLEILLPFVKCDAVVEVPFVLVSHITPLLYPSALLVVLSYSRLASLASAVFTFSHVLLHF